MSASDQMRQMLAQLMGTSHDGEKPRHECQFDDSRVCKSFLLECCPYDLLSNTRMDMGECPKLHDIALRADYNNAQLKKDYYYDLDCLEQLEKFIEDCDHRTELAKKRLKETQEELSEESSSKLAVINGYGEKIGTKLARAEELGAEGNVEESLKLMEEVEELKRTKAAAENEYRNTMPASNYQQQKLRVCEVCSAYLGIHDNDRRLADHFGGRLHVGFITLRGKLAELKENVASRIAKRDSERAERRKALDEADGRRQRSRTPDRRRRSSRTPDRRRDRTPDRRRERTPDRRRERTPDRRRHDRTPDRRRDRTPEKRRRSRTPDRRRSDRDRRSSRDRVERRSRRDSDRDDKTRRRSRSRDRKSRSRRSRSKDSRTKSTRRSRSRSPRRSDDSRSYHNKANGERGGSSTSRKSNDRMENKEKEENERGSGSPRGREEQDEPVTADGRLSDDDDAGERSNDGNNAESSNGGENGIVDKSCD